MRQQLFQSELQPGRQSAAGHIICVMTNYLYYRSAAGQCCLIGPHKSDNHTPNRIANRSPSKSTC